VDCYCQQTPALGADTYSINHFGDGRSRVGSGPDATRGARLQGPITLATVAAVIINPDADAEAKQWQNVCRIMSIDLRAPVASPAPDGYRRLTFSPRVVVHHPGYPDDNTNELFALVATDGSLVHLAYNMA
jgi:hypothetical protein